MASQDDVGWRDHAIALAALGAAALSRIVFRPADAGEPDPLEMEVLVALALRDSPLTEPPSRTGSHWLSLVLRLEQSHVDQLVHRLESAGLVRRASEAQEFAAIQHELAEEADEDAIAGELSIVLTDLGIQAVNRWFSRTRPRFGGWPPKRRDVDDAAG